jgi:homospermidine synthase
MKFSKKIVVLGCGGVAQCCMPLMIKHLKLTPSQITVIDFVDNRDKIPTDINYIVKQITPQNYDQILGEHLKSGDLLVDLAWNISTLDLLIWCKANGVLYVNSSVELWDPFITNSPEKKTLYHRHMEIREATKKWKLEESPTAVLDHGANPGLISSIAKQGIIDIARQIDRKTQQSPKKDELKANLSLHNFPELARLIGLKTIHISEKDSQETPIHKKSNEFVNTWSVMGLYEEGIAPAEMGWGTHENELPKGSQKHTKGPKNQIFLDSKGVDTWVESWVPSGPMTGMVIRHGEAFSLSEYLTCKVSGRVIYRPTIHYAYRPCEETLRSLEDLKSHDYHLQEHQRLISDEISNGKDELGCLFMGHDLGVWWIGSILDINESRKLVPHQNATTVQVAIGVVAAILYCIKNPSEGICLPEDLPHDFVLDIAKPYLGELVSIPTNWRPSKQLKDKNNWRFEVFRLSSPELAEV